MLALQMPILTKIPRTLDDWMPYIIDAIQIVVILAGAFVLTRVARRLAEAVRRNSLRVMQRHGDSLAQEMEKRADTITRVMSNAAIAFIWAAALIMCLEKAGIPVEPLWAGAGAVGVAIGFGAQNLVKDIIGGLFLLVENQVRVNDVAMINGVGGLVEEINLRTTVLRGEDGAVYIFPNGSINTLSNLTHGYSYYVFQIGVSYSDDTDRAIAVMQEVAEQLSKEEPYSSVILAPLEVQGVNSFADSAVILKARIKTVPMKQWMVGREMNRRLKKKFDETGVNIPFPTRTLTFADGAPGLKREELKQAIREVLAEKQE